MKFRLRYLPVTFRRPLVAGPMVRSQPGPGRRSSSMADHPATVIPAHTLTDIAEVNATGLTPVVFIHGLWLLPSSWDRWADVFRAAGYAPITPGWPDDPETVAEANAHPEVLANKTVGQ